MSCTGDTEVESQQDGPISQKVATESQYHHRQKNTREEVILLELGESVIQQRLDHGGPLP
jgi:hypothetical protein